MAALIEIDLKGGDRNTFRETALKNPIQAADLLETELRKFDDWMVDGRNMDPLTRYERQILREYLGFKLLQPAPSETDAG